MLNIVPRVGDNKEQSWEVSPAHLAPVPPAPHQTLYPLP